MTRSTTRSTAKSASPERSRRRSFSRSGEEKKRRRRRSRSPTHDKSSSPRKRSKSKKHRRSSSRKRRTKPRFPSTRFGSSVFFLPSHVYLASSDRIDLVHSNGRRLKNVGLAEIDTYASVIGGFSGLNYLLELHEPKRIILFDVNPYAVSYCRLFVELIQIASSHTNLMARIFGRTIPKEMELSHHNQDEYLAQNYEPEVVEDTLAKLTPESREIYNTYLMPFVRSQTGTVPERSANCNRLVPCWEYGKYVPVSAGGSSRRDSDGEGRLVPNTNTFYFGVGWLKSEWTFLHIRRLLQRCELIVQSLDVLKPEIDDLLVPRLDKAAVMHISNIDDFFVNKWSKRLHALKKEAIRRGGSITIISATNGVRHYSKRESIHLPAHDF